MRNRLRIGAVHVAYDLRLCPDAPSKAALHFLHRIPTPADKLTKTIAELVYLHHHVCLLVGYAAPMHGLTVFMGLSRHLETRLFLYIPTA